MAAELGDGDLRALLESARVVAVLGAHTEMSRPACYVPAYLYANGYRVVPVNPECLGQTIWGEPFRAALGEIDEAIDVVDVFRPGGEVAAHVDEILAMALRPKAVWLQLGVRDDASAGRLVEAGVDVVQDRCMLREHRRLQISPVVKGS